MSQPHHHPADPDWQAISDDLATNRSRLVAMVQRELRRGGIAASHDEAEDIVGTAAAELYEHARRTGIPADGPQLTNRCQQRAIDRIRRERTLHRNYGRPTDRTITGQDEGMDRPLAEASSTTPEDEALARVLLSDVLDTPPPFPHVLHELAARRRLSEAGWEAVRDLVRDGLPPADAATRQRRKRTLDRVGQVAETWISNRTGRDVTLGPEETLALLEVTGAIDLALEDLVAASARP